MRRADPDASPVKRLLGALQLRGDAAGDPIAQTLHALMLIVLALTTTHVSIALVNFHNKMLIVLTGFPLVFTPAATLALLRRNAVRAAGVVYLVGMWVAFTNIIVINGGIRYTGWAIYMALAVSAAWLFGYRAALWMAGSGVACMLAMAILENEGMAPPRLLPGTPMGVWMLMIESTVMGVMPVSQVLSRYREALGRSQRAEAELKIHQQRLEELVDQRTAELVEARDQAQAASRAKSIFLAHMSHELRTPLTAILGYSALLCDDPGLAERHRKDLRVVSRSGEHLLSLIDDVLDVAKIEAGRMVVRTESFALQQLVRTSVELMRPAAEGKGLTLELRQSPGVPTFIRSDPGKLRQILLNLLGNAVKFTSRGGITVIVDASIGTDRTTLLLEVTDTGVGIPAEEQARIFSPFVQVGGWGSQKGTGLGLAISRSFAELLGGSVTVESAPDKGSVFRVELPVEVTEEAAAGGADEAHPRAVGLTPGQPPLRVLIVEDQEENRAMLARILSEVGFEVRAAVDGESALDLFLTWPPHFVWMDLRLPGIGGVETARLIRERPGGAEVKIAALTASALSVRRDDALASGLDDLIRKPYRREEILDCMARLTGVRYRYEEGPAQTEARPAALDAIAGIPAAVREELLEAVVGLDPEPISAAIRRVSECDPTLGSALDAYARRLEFSKIYAALNPPTSTTSGRRA